MPEAGSALNLRLLQVVTDTDRRGAQLFACDLQRALSAADVEVRTVALSPGEVGGLRLPTLGPRRRHPSNVTALRRLARTADVVAAHGSTTLPMTALALAGTDVRFVYRNLGDPLQWANTRARRLRTQALLRRADRVLALWQGVRQVLETSFGVPPHRIAVIPNGVDVDRFQPVPPRDRPALRARLGLDSARDTVAFVGALSPEKALTTAIAALADVDHAQLVVAGDGPLRAELQRQAQDIAGDRVRFLGAVDDPRAVYGAADCVVLPSRTEGLPAVLIEAGLMALPAVATRVGGVPEVVTERTGALVAPGDVPATAAALRRVLANRQEMGREARTHCCAHYDLRRVAEQWHAVLQQSTRPAPAA